ncbi:hypothetical protein ACFX1X_008553 [Malus domestica]
MVFQQEREMKIMKNVAAQPLPVARMTTTKFKERHFEVDELASDWWWLCWHSFFNLYYSYAGTTTTSRPRVHQPQSSPLSNNNLSGRFPIQVLSLTISPMNLGW